MSLRPSFAERTLLGLSGLVRDGLGASEEARRPGALQALDPRAKLLAGLALLLGMSLSHSILGVAATGLLALVLAKATRLDLWPFVRRTWLVVPVFTALVALPATLNVTTPGRTLLAIGATPAFLRRLGWPEVLAVTAPGLLSAVQLILRVGGSVSIASLITRTSAPGSVLGALRALGVPRAFVLVATMTERYIWSLTRTVEEMHMALISRRLRPLGARESRAFVSSRMGVVLMKARATAEDVHSAMVARGFRGDVKTLDEPRLRGRDVLAVALAAAWAAGVVVLGRAGLP